MERIVDTVYPWLFQDIDEAVQAAVLRAPQVVARVADKGFALYSPRSPMKGAKAELLVLTASVWIPLSRPGEQVLAGLPICA